MEVKHTEDWQQKTTKINGVTYWRSTDRERYVKPTVTEFKEGHNPRVFDV